MLLETLLQRQSPELLEGLQQLRGPSGIVRRSGVGGEEGAGHHLETRVDEAGDLWNEGLQSPAALTGIPSLLGTKARVTKGRRRAGETVRLAAG